MSRIRKLLIMSGATAALSVATLGAIPTAAADTQGTLAIVNGVPGRRLDVCVNGTEIKSGLRYGKAVFRSVISTGEKVLKFYDPDPRTCKGHLRAEHDGFNLAAGGDITAVVTKNGPDRGRPLRQCRPWRDPPAGAPMATGWVLFRNASEIVANFFVRFWTPIAETPIDPAANPLAGKGESYATGTGTDYIWQLRVTRPEDPDTIGLRKVTTRRVDATSSSSSVRLRATPRSCCSIERPPAVAVGRDLPGLEQAPGHHPGALVCLRSGSTGRTRIIGSTPRADDRPPRAR